MRPSDENQASLKQSGARPNLMSPAGHGGREDSILARLDSAQGTRGSGARLAWYGTAALVAVGLTATLAWLAAGTGRPALEVAQAGELRMATPHPVVERQAAALAPMLPSTLPSALPVKAAVIVDAPPASAPEPATPAAAARLRLLDPAPLPPPPRMAPPPASAATASKPAERTAAPARPRTQPARPPQRQAARPARTAPARPGETGDDSDVALISAVIYHANGHADGQDAACTAESCASRPARP